MTVDPLEAALVQLGSALDLPTGGDGFADAVVARLTERRPAHGRGARLVGAAAAVVLAVAVTVLLTIGSAREAVAGWLGLGVVRVEQVEKLPATSRQPGDGARPSSLAEAREAMGFSMLVPADMGQPDDVVIGAPLDGVTMRWEGLTITQQPAENGSLKLITNETQVEPVLVRNQPGVWLSGEAHVLTEGGTDHTGAGPSRLVPNALVWEEGDAVIRIEIDGSLAQALAAAERLE
jgi:hypothetical protein